MNKTNYAILAVSIIFALLVGSCLTFAILHFSGLRLVEQGEFAVTEKLNEAVQIIDKYYIGDFDSGKLADYAVYGMINSLSDEWSYYLTADDLARFMEMSKNEYSGIGIVVQSADDGSIKIASVYRQSPAAEAGIQVDSTIIAVDGEELSGLSYNEVIDKLQAGIDSGGLELTLKLPDGTESIYELIPGSVGLDPVRYELLSENIGYIKIENFEDKCSQQAIDAIEQLTSQGANSLIFDLRNNPGGKLTELLALLDYILPQGEIFISKDSFGNESKEYSEESCVTMPMAALINGETYSAAEFFAAALNEYNWAFTVGDCTTGKGYAQVTVAMSDGSAIHISNMEYFTPNGISLAGIGLAPDYPVEMSQEDFALLYYDTLAHDNDVQLQKALTLMKDELKKAS